MFQNNKILLLHILIPSDVAVVECNPQHFNYVHCIHKINVGYFIQYLSIQYGFIYRSMNKIVPLNFVV